MGLGPSSGGGGGGNRDVVNIGMTPFYRSLPSRVVWSDIARMAQESGQDVKMHAWPAYQMMSKESWFLVTKATLESLMFVSTTAVSYLISDISDLYNYYAYWPSCPSTIGSIFATTLPFWFV